MNSIIQLHQGQTLKKAIQDSGLSLSDFAAKYGIHRNSLKESTFQKKWLSSQLLNSLRNNGFNMGLLEISPDMLLQLYEKACSEIEVLKLAMGQLTAHNAMLKDQLNKLQEDKPPGQA